MEKPTEEAAIAEIGTEISPPSAKRPRRCVQSKLSWVKPPDEEVKLAAVEEEKEKAEEIGGGGKKRGRPKGKSQKKELKSCQSKLPWVNPRAEEGSDEPKVIVTKEEEREESKERKDEGTKKGRKRKSLPKTPQKSPGKNNEARRTSARNKSNMNCQQLNEHTGEDTPKTPPTSRNSDHDSGSSSKKRSYNRRSGANKDIDGQTKNIRGPLTNLWLEAKLASEENLRLSAGKQTHPFFVSLKTAKRMLEGQENKKMEARCWPGLDGDYTVSCPPVHVFESVENDIASFDWKNWEFTQTSLFDSNVYCAIEKASSIFDNCVKPLILDSLDHEDMHLNHLSDGVDEQQLYTESADSTSLKGQQLDVIHISGNASLLPGDVCCAENLESKQQDRLFTERLTSYHRRISFSSDCSLWTNKYQPENALEVCGNSESVRFLSEWLKSWNERALQNSIKKNILERSVTEDSEDSIYEMESDMDDETSLKNVLLITGPVGSGKSAAIYACAKEQGFEVIEVNTSDVRNGAHLKQEFGQAMDSHALNKWSFEDPDGHGRKHIFDLLSSPTDVGDDEDLGTSSVEITARSCKRDVIQTNSSWSVAEKITAAQTANKTLLLFEDVDTVFDEDRGFIASILQLVQTAKRPIILTSNYRKPVLPQLLDRLTLNFILPTSEELLSHLYMICASEKVYVSSCVLEQLVGFCVGDIRKTIMLLQFWCQGNGLLIDLNTQDSYKHLFDIDAAHWVVPRMIPWSLPCKLSEKVGEEIEKTTAVLEDNLHQMEPASQDLSFLEIINLPDQHVATPAKPRKRALRKKNPSFINSTELLDHANDIEDFYGTPDSPETNPQRALKGRRNLVLLSQSDDGSADEHPSTETTNSHQRLDMLTTPISQTTEVLNLFELPIDPIYRCVGDDTVQLPSENFDTASVSHICDTFRLQDASCIPESSFISGNATNIEDDNLARSSYNVSFNIDDSIMPIRVLSGENNYPDRTIIELGKGLVDSTVNTCDIDLESVNGNEEQGDSQNGNVSPSCGYQLMDECSQAYFNELLLPKRTSEYSPEVDLVQETWRKLRCDREDLKSYIAANTKDVSSIVHYAFGLADLISEADVMFKSCHTLINDAIEPSFMPSVEPDVCSYYEEQVEMASTFAQHGICFYASKFAKIGPSLGLANTVNLAQEMITSSKSTMALGKLLSKGNTTAQNLHLEESLYIKRPRCSIPTGREMESKLYDAILSTVPARLSMVLRDSALHEYASFLSKLSRQEYSRLTQNIERRKRSRASRHYLSSGLLSLCDEHVRLLAQSGCFRSSTLQH